MLGIFTGTELASLSRVVSGNAAEGPDCPYGQRQYSFEAIGGTDYVIGVDGDAFSFPEGPPLDDEGTIGAADAADAACRHDDGASPGPIN